MTGELGFVININYAHCTKDSTSVWLRLLAYFEELSVKRFWADWWNKTVMKDVYDN